MSNITPIQKRGVGMALKNPKKQHRGTFNPYPSGVFTRCESKVIGNIFCPLASNRASISVGEVCKMLVLNRLNSPKPLYKVEDWADHVSTIDLFGIPSYLLNDDKLGRCSASSSYATSGSPLSS